MSKKFKLYIHPRVLEQMEIVPIAHTPNQYDYQEQAEALTILLADGVWAGSNDILRDNGILPPNIGKLIFHRDNILKKNEIELS